MNVFDASAVLATLLDEPGGEACAKLMESGAGMIGSVNYVEVMTKLFDLGVSQADAATAWHNLPLDIEPLDAATALTAARLRPLTRALGLSLGDRCCLALAQARDAAVVTADRQWKKLKGFDVVLIR